MNPRAVATPRIDPRERGHGPTSPTLQGALRTILAEVRRGAIPTARGLRPGRDDPASRLRFVIGGAADRAIANRSAMVVPRSLTVTMHPDDQCVLERLVGAIEHHLNGPRPRCGARRGRAGVQR